MEQLNGLHFNAVIYTPTHQYSSPIAYRNAPSMSATTFKLVSAHIHPAARADDEGRKSSQHRRPDQMV